MIHLRSGCVWGAELVVFAGTNGQDRAVPVRYGDSDPMERPGVTMIFGKLWRALSAQFNKMANMFWTADPIAQMQYEYDLAVDQLKGGREGLEQYRALVERVGRQVANNQTHVSNLEAKIKAYLSTGDRDTASKFAL